MLRVPGWIRWTTRYLIQETLSNELGLGVPSLSAIFEELASALGLLAVGWVVNSGERRDSGTRGRTKKRKLLLGLKRGLVLMIPRNSHQPNSSTSPETTSAESLEMVSASASNGQERFTHDLFRI